MDGTDTSGLPPGTRIKKGQVLSIELAGEKIGTLKVLEYKADTTSGDKYGRATLALLPTISEEKIPDDCLFRWRQHFSVYNSRGEILDHTYEEGGQIKRIPGKNVLDPTPGTDDAEWYFTKDEWPRWAAAANSEVIAGFHDRATLTFARLFGKDFESVTREFYLELVQVEDLEQKTGGKTILGITWGLTISKPDEVKLLLPAQ